MPLSSVSKFRHSDDDYDDDDEDDDEEEDGSDSDQIDGDAGDDLDSFDDEAEDNIDNSIPANSTIVTSVLHLNDVDHSDAGRYQCIVSNKFGTTYSHRFKVSVACKSSFMRKKSFGFIKKISKLNYPITIIQQHFQYSRNGRKMLRKSHRAPFVLIVVLRVTQSQRFIGNSISVTIFLPPENGVCM